MRSFCLQMERSWCAVGAPARLASGLAHWSELTLHVLIEHIFEKVPGLGLFRHSATGASSTEGTMRVLVQRVLSMLAAGLVDANVGAKLAAYGSEDAAKSPEAQSSRSDDKPAESQVSTESDITLAELQGKATNLSVYATIWGLGGALGSAYPSSGGSSGSGGVPPGDPSAGAAGGSGDVAGQVETMFGDLSDEFAFTRILLNSGAFFAAQATKRGGEPPQGAHVDALGESINCLAECLRDTVRSASGGASAAGAGDGSSSELREFSSVLAYVPVHDPNAAVPEARQSSAASSGSGSDRQQYVPSPAAGTAWIPAADVSIALAHWKNLSGQSVLSAAEVAAVQQAVAAACLRRRRNPGKYDRSRYADVLPSIGAASYTGGKMSFLPFPTRSSRLRAA